MNIIPAIIGDTIYAIEEKLDAVSSSVDWVQIDIVDGDFAGPPTWPYTTLNIDQEITKLGDLFNGLNVELHLMITNPEDTLDEWVDTGAKRIFVHQESTNDLENIISFLDMSQCESGVSLNLDTPIETLEQYSDKLDAIQLMSIPSIGSYGEVFDESVLEKIETLRDMFPEKTINVDGGINIENVRSVMDSGATNAVVGSAIFGSEDVGQAIEDLKSI